MKKRFLAMLLVVCIVLSITPTSTFAEISLQVGEGNVCTRYIHDEKCGYSPLAAQVDCDKNCTNINSDGVIDHAADCVYLPAVAESPCNFDVTGCEICHPKMSKLPMLVQLCQPKPLFWQKQRTPPQQWRQLQKKPPHSRRSALFWATKQPIQTRRCGAVYDSEAATTAIGDIVANCNANTRCGIKIALPIKLGRA